MDMEEQQQQQQATNSKAKIKFFARSRGMYQAPTERIRSMIERIGWAPLFRPESVLQQQRFNLGDEQRSILVDFICSYDPVSKSGYAAGVRLFVTRQAIAQTFGFPEDRLQKVRAKGSSQFRCKLLKEDAKASKYGGMPLHCVRDEDIRRMLQAANAMLTGKPNSTTVIKSSLLQAVWESLQSGTRFDWPAFMLDTIDKHLHSLKRRLEDTGACTIGPTEQLVAILQEALAAKFRGRQALAQPPPPESAQAVLSGEIGAAEAAVPVVVGLPAAAAVYDDDPMEVDVEDLCQDQAEDPAAEDQAEDPGAEEQAEDPAAEQAEDQASQGDPFESFLFLMKKTVMKLVVLRSSSSSSSSRRRSDIHQQISGMETELRNLVATAAAALAEKAHEHVRLKRQARKAGKTRQQALLNDKLEEVSSLEMKVEGLEEANAVLRQKLHDLESENSSLQAANSALEAESEEAQRKSNVLEAENEKLMRFFLDEEFKNKAAALEAELQAQVSKLRLLEEEWLNNKTALQAELQAQVCKYGLLQAELQAQVSKFGLLEEEWLNNKTALQAELQAQVSKFGLLEEEWLNNKAENSSLKSQLQARPQLEEERRKTAATEAENSSLKSRLQQLQGEWRAALISLGQNESTLKRNVRELESLKVANEHITKELDDLKQEMSSVEKLPLPQMPHLQKLGRDLAELDKLVKVL